MRCPDCDNDLMDVKTELRFSVVSQPAATVHERTDCLLMQLLARVKNIEYMVRRG